MPSVIWTPTEDDTSLSEAGLNTRLEMAVLTVDTLPEICQIPDVELYDPPKAEYKLPVLVLLRVRVAVI